MHLGGGLGPARHRSLQHAPWQRIGQPCGRARRRAGAAAL